MSKPVKIELKQLRPTQITVGMLEVEDKRAHLSSLSGGELKSVLRELPMPTVLGPQGKHYITDHHHLGRALWEAKIDFAYAQVIGDLSELEMEAFWDAMIAKQWVHPYDELGILHGVAAIPPDVAGLVDDPYRSLASFVRDAGGYAKSDHPFADFQWADFFRSRCRLWKTPPQFQAAVQQATHLARSPDARVLPGYIRDTE